MRVLKVIAEGITTSFRYPHFMQQIHPTFPMPPPATIYGHIASVLGEWFDPTGVEFAYRFTYAGEVTDIEHIMLMKRAVGKLKGTDIPKVQEGRINPFERRLLYRPQLTLYINQPQWKSAFRSPRYAVVLGRSQDLFTYTSVETLELQRATAVYFEHTLLPYSVTLRTMRGIAIMMPRFLDYTRRRYPTFARYYVLQERVYSDEFLRFGEGDSPSFWVDPTTPTSKRAQLGLSFHTFVGDDLNDTATVA